MEVSIRPLEEDDARISYHWRNDPEIWKYTGSSPQHTVTLEDELAWIGRVRSEETSRRFAILADTVYVGNIYLTDISNGEGDYHIFIGNKDYMGKGIARQASELLIDFAHRELNLQSISLQVRPENTRAIQLYISLGFAPTKEDADFITMRLQL